MGAVITNYLLEKVKEKEATQKVVGTHPYDRTVLLVKLKTSETSTSFISSRRLLLRNTKVRHARFYQHAFIFVCLETFGLQGPESYLYTSRSGCLDVDGINDVNDFNDTLVSLIAIL